VRSFFDKSLIIQLNMGIRLSILNISIHGMGLTEKRLPRILA